jgi:hypothetical protein
MRERILTAVVALTLLPACFEDAGDGKDEIGETGDGDMTGDGDGDQTGDGDGDGDGDEETTGDGDGDMTGDGDGDMTGDGDGEPAAVCGNGIVEVGEACDNGDENALEPGACAPNCSTIIQTKRLQMSGEINGAAFQPNPVAYADSRCPPGYKAMFAFSNARVATTVGWQTVNSIDWPVKPFTAYYNLDDVLVWVTDEVALLAIRDGARQLPIDPFFPCPMFCLGFKMVSGLLDDGTTSVSATCDGWTTTNQGFVYNQGSFTTLEYQTGTNGCPGLDGDDDPNTLSFPRFLCVEQ